MIAEPNLSEPRPSSLTQVVYWSALVAVYSWSRLFAATNGIPLFIDEAIHVDWARPSAHTFLPLDPSFDGKWLSIKLFAAATHLPGLNSVLAARLLVSVLGLATALAIYLIGRDLFSRFAGGSSAVLYVVLPFTIIYNTLALSDGVQLGFAAWAVFAAVRVVRSDRWVSASVALPFLLGAAILSKFSGVVLAILPLIAVLLLTRPAKWPRGLMRIAPALIAAGGLVAWLYSRGMLEVFKTKASGSETGATKLIWQNLLVTGSWFWGLLTPVIAILAIAAFAWQLVRARQRAAWFLAGLLGLNVLPYLLVARVWYPRYLLLAVIPIVLVIGGTLSHLVAWLETYKRSQRRLVWILIATISAGILIWPAARSAFVMFDLPDAALPQIEQYQLVNGWPSGYGTPELVMFLREQADATRGGVTVARTVVNDHPLHTLNIYLVPSERLSLFTMGDDNPVDVLSLAQLSSHSRVLLVLATDDGAEKIRPPAVPLLQCGKAIWSYTKPKGKSGFVVYELRCDENQIKTLTTQTVRWFT